MGASIIGTSRAIGSESGSTIRSRLIGSTRASIIYQIVSIGASLACCIIGASVTVGDIAQSSASTATKAVPSHTSSTDIVLETVITSGEIACHIGRNGHTGYEINQDIAIITLGASWSSTRVQKPCDCAVGNGRVVGNAGAGGSHESSVPGGTLTTDIVLDTVDTVGDVADK